MSALITSFTGSKRNVSYVSYSYQWQPRVIVPDKELQNRPPRHPQCLIPEPENEDLDASAADERDDTVPELLTRIPSRSDLKIAKQDSASFMPVTNWIAKPGTPEPKRSVSPSTSAGSVGEEKSWWSKTSVTSHSTSSDRLRPSTAKANLFFRRSRKGLDLGESAPSIRGRSVLSGAEGFQRVQVITAEPRGGTKQKKMSSAMSTTGGLMSPSSTAGTYDSRKGGQGVWESMEPTQSEIIVKSRIRPDPVRPPLPENAVFYTPPSKFAARPVTAHEFRLNGQHSMASHRPVRTNFRDGHSLLSQPAITDLSFSSPSSGMRLRHGSVVSEASSIMEGGVRPYSRWGEVPMPLLDGFQVPLRYVSMATGSMPRQVRSRNGLQREGRSRKVKARAASANDATRHASADDTDGRALGGVMEDVLLPW